MTEAKHPGLGLFRLISERGDRNFDKVRKALRGMTLKRRNMALTWVREPNKNSNKCTSLIHVAAENDAVEIFRLLVEEYGANVNFAAKDGRTPLHFAAFNNSVKVASYLMGVRDPVVFVTHKDKDGRTPLHSAVKNGSTGVMEVILSNVPGIINMHDRFNSPPLYLAIYLKKKEAFDLLLARSELDLPPETLIYAIKHDPSGEFVRRLINRGASATFAREIDGMTPLHRAANKFNLEATRMLLRLPDVSVNVRDRNNETPLHFAVKDMDDEHKRKVALLLIDHGADLKAVNNDGKSPLDLVSDEGHRELLSKWFPLRGLRLLTNALRISSDPRYLIQRKVLELKDLRLYIESFIHSSSAQV